MSTTSRAGEGPHKCDSFTRNLTEIISLNNHTEHYMQKLSCTSKLNSSSFKSSEAVKQTTCTTAATSSNVVYKCRQCNRLFVSLISVQEHRLAVHAASSDLIGCGLQGKTQQTDNDVKSFSNHHSIGCGLCGDTYWTEQDAKCCFYQHTQNK